MPAAACLAVLACLCLALALTARAQIPTLRTTNGTYYYPQIPFAVLQAANVESAVAADQWCASPGTLNDTCFSRALAAIGSKPTTMLVPNGDYRIDADLTFPANVALLFARGAVLEVQTPHVVQINGAVVAGNWQIFSTALPTAATGTMTAAGSTLTVSGATLSAADVGSAVYLAGASTTTHAVSYEHQLMGWGDGSTTAFSLTAAHLPVTTGTVTVAAGNCIGEDNGSGSISNLSWSSCPITGTVNYSSGAISATFGTAPGSGYPVMAGFSFSEHEPSTGTITAVNSSTSATVSFSAGESVSGASVLFGGSYVKLAAADGFNPFWWGAAGDGVTDDYAPLQEALTACGEATGQMLLPRAAFATSLPLEAGDPFKVGVYTSSGQVQAQCNIQGQQGGLGGWQQGSVFLALSGFPSGDYVLTRENMANSAWADFEVDANATGANGIDVAWREVSGISPSAVNSFEHISVFNAQTISWWLDNQNDSTIFRDVGVQERATDSISFLAGGAGGNLNFTYDYGGDLWVISAQNINLQSDYAARGIEFDGFASNFISMQGGQVFGNANTGVALDSTSSGGDGSESLTCTECYIGLGNGNKAISGKWGTGASFNGGTVQVPSGTASFFGTIRSGLTPAFSIYRVYNEASLNTPGVGTVTVGPCSGSVSLASGSASVSAACLTGQAPISLSVTAAGGTQGFLRYSVSLGSLSITSSSASDTSTVTWVQH